MVIDSLTGILESSPDEETKMNTLRNLYWKLERSEPEKAREYIERSIAMAEKLKDANGIAQGKYAFSGYYQMKGEYETAIKILNESLHYFQQLGDTKRVNDCMLDIGQAYYLSSKYYMALEYYLKAIRGFENAKLESSLGRAYNSLANLYKTQERYEEALESYMKALELCEKYNIDRGIAVCVGNIGIMHHELENYDQALDHYQRAIKLYDNLGDKVGVAKVNNNIGLSYAELENYSKALSFHKKAQKLYEELNHAEGIAIAYVNIGYDYSKLGDTKKSLEHYMKCLEMSSKFHFKNLSVQTYTNLSTLYAELGDYENAYTYQLKFKALSDSLTTRKNDEVLLRLETQFESEQKEKQISLLQKDNEIKELKLNRTRTFSIVGAIFTFLSAISLYFIFRNYQHRRNLQEMERLRNSDRKLLDMKGELIRTVVDTEEKERKRISADLHDEMGPMLSGLRLYLGEIEDTQGEEQSELVETALEIVDEAIKELRHISQNLLPTSISEKGLVETLNVFFNKIHATGAVNIDFKSQMGKLKINQAKELILYRVISELTNNTLKHASAKKITLNMVDEDHSILIDYQDDGCGFSIEALSENEGLGLKSVQDRILSIDGKIDIGSEVNRGTTVKIEIQTP
jgi:signal transduction histidine kinase/sugar phosphate isomerase/epimerase